MMKTVRTWLRRIMLLGVIAGGWAVHTADKNDGPSPTESKAVALSAAVEPVVSGLDRVEMVDGSLRQGTLLPQAFTLRTGYGTIVVGADQWARLELDHEGQGLAVLRTFAGARLSGFLEETHVRLRGDTGEEARLRLSSVRRVMLRERDSALLSRAAGDSLVWVELRNGDRLTGIWLTDPWSVVASNQVSQVAISNLLAMQRAAAPKQFTIDLRSGTSLTGEVNEQELTFELREGVRLRLEPVWIRGMARPDEASSREEGSSPSSPRLGSKGAPRAIPGLVWIPPGAFRMGSPTDESGRDQDEGPLTQFVFEQGFWMGRCEVTQAEYAEVMGNNPSNDPSEASRPVEKVNWHEAQDYTRRLNQRAEAAGQLPEGYLYRLPTEAEWEYACRAGTSTRFSHGEDRDYRQLQDYAWFVGNSDSMTHPVGTRRPNPWGLHDMHGNVWEWCLDRWDGSLPGGTITHRAGTATGRLRVARGGSWLYEGRSCRAANRDDYSPSNRCSDLGFRVVLAPLTP